MSEHLTIGDVLFYEGVTGIVDEVEIDDEGQIVGFILRDGTRAHHFNLDLMLEDALMLMKN